ncbi:hypothetical protein V2S66_15430 [Streptomyces sp. V4-01]|uniref:Transglycosylase SLT domain-containing protein n=1 Tax=Actinacidiphila polyblastidii TaxID=3110430 RepID=A0ABU7PDI9_9ACTN|nr:hypothetical protein [Streptomyces sp. V4-01]
MNRRFRIPVPRVVSPLTAMVTLMAGLTVFPLVASNTAAQADAAPARQRLFPDAGKALGGDYTSSSDFTVQGTGDSAGFHILLGTEREGFAFHEIARLGSTDLMDAGPWTGEVCTTGSGRYAAAVYAPSLWTNTPGAMARGAFAAVIRLSDGKVTPVTSGVQLAYFSPGCGDGDLVDFTRSTVTDTSAGDTTVFRTDAATGRITSTSTVSGQATHVVPTAQGTVAVLDDNLVTLTPDAAHRQTLKATVRAALPGPVFALTPATGGDLDLGTVEKGQSVIHRFHAGTLTRLGAGKVGDVKLFPGQDGDIVVGDVRGVDTAHAPGLSKHVLAKQPESVSRQGHLVITSLASDQMKGITTQLGSPSLQGVGVIRMTGVASRSGAVASSAVGADPRVPLSSATGPAPSAGAAPASPSATAAATKVKAATAQPAAATATAPDDTEPRNCGEGALESQCIAAGVPVYGDVPGFDYPCVVKRLDPKRQAVQASANLVEWAVDQGVHGDLTVQRPKDYNDTGLAAYTPQGLFAPPVLSGGGQIPAQLVLGLLAQESNFKQASWHALYGTSGDPTQADWFGNGDSIHYYPDSGKADCGYGIAQVTTGMSVLKSPQYDTLHAGAIATDYAANIAAGLDILAEKWNQLQDLQMHVNNNSPKYLENWYMALWGYNSGVYTDPNNKEGLGYLNNPANPTYAPDRKAFLLYNYDDASKPAGWPYQEKVLGWSEVPQLTWNGNPSYAKPSFGGLGIMENLPTNYFLFCDQNVNACTPNAADPCPTWDDQCRWDASVSWIDDQQDGNSTREKLAYSLGSSEPPLQHANPTGPCLDGPVADDPYTLIVDDLDAHEDTYGCGDFEGADDGKFSLQLGDNFTYYRDDQTMRGTPYIAQIDLHQIGSGYDGHSFFTHSYPTNDWFHKVTASWEPNPIKVPPFDQPGGQRYDVWIHLPATAAQAIVRYNFIPGRNNDGFVTHNCRINQATHSNGQDTWLEMGSFPFWKGGRITADNLHDAGTGDADVAFDAVAFEPAVVGVQGTCKFGY